MDTNKTTEEIPLRRSKKSRFRNFIKSDYLSVFLIITLSLSILIFRGKGAQGQTNVFDDFLRDYIEETATSIIPTANSDPVDINSLVSNPVSISNGENLVGTIQQNSLLSYNSIVGTFEEITGERNEVITYEVLPGDVLSLIARDYGVSVNSLMWANGLINADAIKPGQKLKIPPVSGVIHTVKSGDTVSSLVSKYGANVEEIIEFNDLPKDGTLQIGADIIIPGGEIKVRSTPTRRVRYVATRPFANLPQLTGYFFHPTGGAGRISQYTHGRNAIDVAAPCGTPLYAAANGTVTRSFSSGWNGGYGLYVKLAHPNGTATVYGHASKVLVQRGQPVTKGQKIALVGSTGRSTGCHVHYEVHGAQNPLNRR